MSSRCCPCNPTAVTPPERSEWAELVIGAAIAIGFKLLLHNDDLSRCRWNKGFREVFHTRAFLPRRAQERHVQRQLPGRDRASRILRIGCVVARAVFRTGFVLAAIDPL
jgi:hypothetical protein